MKTFKAMVLVVSMLFFSFNDVYPSDNSAFGKFHSNTGGWSDHDSRIVLNSEESATVTTLSSATYDPTIKFYRPDLTGGSVGTVSWISSSGLGSGSGLSFAISPTNVVWGTETAVTMNEVARFRRDKLVQFLGYSGGGADLMVTVNNDGVLGTQVIPTGGGGNGWDLSGNVVAPGNFLGTLNNEDLVFQRNSSVAMGVYTANNYIGINEIVPSALFHLSSGNVMFEGDGSSPASVPVTGAGTRMMWLPEKSSLRAGGVSGDEWDYGNIAPYSIAMGFDNKASGKYSTVFGNSNTVTEVAGVALGEFNVSSNYAATAIGYSNVASGSFSFASGINSIASGTASVAMGANNTVTAGASFALGSSNTISGEYSGATGSDHDVSSSYSFVTGYKNIVGGDFNVVNGSNNFVLGQGSVVSGIGNFVFYPFATVSGFSNTVSRPGAMAIGGLNSVAGSYSMAAGHTNFAGGDFSIALGEQNYVTGAASLASGSFNSVQGNFSVAMGFYSTVGMGHDNSFAFGRRATTTSDRQFMAKFTGGGTNTLADASYVFITNAGGTEGSYMESGTSGWSNISDRDLKTNIIEVDSDYILAAFENIPVSKWQYKGSEREVQYIGPMAQDLHANFDIKGKSKLALNSIDMDGINFAGVRALVFKVKELEEVNNLQGQKITKLESRLLALENGGNPEPFKGPVEIDYSGIILEQNTPNPFANETTINYVIPEQYNGVAQIVVTSMHGSEMLMQLQATKGSPSQATIDCDGWSSGVYTYSILLNGQLVKTRKMIIMK